MHVIRDSYLFYPTSLYLAVFEVPPMLGFRCTLFGIHVLQNFFNADKSP